MATATEYVMRVRSSDIDSQDIVNNAKYFEFFQDARLDHMQAIRSPSDPWPAGNSFAIAQTTCAFKSSLRHRDEVVVRAWTSEIRTRSFILAYDIKRPDGSLVAEGTSVQVWLDGEGTPTPIPDPVRRALEGSMA